MAWTDRLASVGALAGGVIHELSNPLTITAFNIDSAIDEPDRALGSEKLDRAPEVDEARGLLVDALASAHRMGKLLA